MHTEILCQRNCPSLLSPDTLDMHRPKSLMNSLESELEEPRFSKASGINLYADGSPWYLASFLAEINSAADPQREEEAARYDSARVVATVTSHAMSFPSRHGSDVAPFGLFPEPLTNLSLIHISEPTRLLSISYAVFC